jgi:hypothetical protein
MDLLVQTYNDGMNRLVEEEKALHFLRKICEKHLFGIWIMACEENGIDLVDGLVERIRSIALNGV